MVVPSAGAARRRPLECVLGCVLLVAACASSGIPEGRQGVEEAAGLRVVQSRGDGVSVGVDGELPAVVVRRERGIGGVTLEVDGGAWPVEVVVVLEGFANLESFAACSEGRCLETDLGSAPRARMREGNGERWAVGVEIVVHVHPGSIRVAVPAAAVAGGTSPLELRWVDEYRD